MNVILHLKIAGALQIALAISHFWIPKYFGWKEDSAKMSLFNRQVFYVHCFFIVLILLLFGTLSIGCADLLTRPDPLAKWLLLGITLFWLARLICQFFVYDTRLWRGNPLNTAMHGVSSVMWGYYVLIYGAAFWQQLQATP